MTRQPAVARRAEALLGTAVVATAPAAGGDISTATKLRLSDGSTALMKTHPHAPPEFFEVEAAGLRWLAEAHEAGGVPVPEVLAVDHECLVLRWVEPAKLTVDGASGLRGGAGGHPRRRGTVVRRPSRRRRRRRAPRRLHRPAAPARSAGADLGGVLRDPAGAPLSQAGARPGPGDRRGRGGDRGRPGKAAELVPEEPPARLHGDLWNGNVVWGAEGRGWVIDPAAHGGHRETDLAMLALFGLPHLARVLEAYEQASPLAEGWESRQGLHQLFRSWCTRACSAAGTPDARQASQRATSDRRADATSPSPAAPHTPSRRNFTFPRCASYAERTQLDLPPPRLVRRADATSPSPAASRTPADATSPSPAALRR